MALFSVNAYTNRNLYFPAIYSFVKFHTLKYDTKKEMPYVRHC